MPSVQVQGENGKVVTVTCNPTTQLINVLKDACDKLSLDFRVFGLSFKSKSLDLSTPYRSSGLLASSCVHLTKVSLVGKKVRIALRCPANVPTLQGKQWQGTVPVQMVLWEILGEAEKSLSVELRSLTKDGKRQLPVFSWLNWQSPESLKYLKETALADIGLREGSAAFRLSYIAYEEKEEDREDGINRNEKSSSKEPLSSAEKIRKSDAEGKETLVSESSCFGTKEKEKRDRFQFDPMKPFIFSHAAEDEEVIRQSLPSVNPVSKKAKLARIDRRPRVIRHHAGAVADIDLPDEFYTPSTSDLRQEIKVLAEGGSVHSFKSKMMEEEERERRLTNARVRVRVKLPDNIYLEGNFLAHEKTDDIVQFVKDCLQDPTSPFQLFTTPPKRDLPKGSTLLSLNLIPSVLVHFSTSQGTLDAPLLRQDIPVEDSDDDIALARQNYLPGGPAPSKKEISSTRREDASSSSLTSSSNVECRRKEEDSHSSIKSTQYDSSSSAHNFPASSSSSLTSSPQPSSSHSDYSQSASKQPAQRLTSMDGRPVPKWFTLGKKR